MVRFLLILSQKNRVRFLRWVFYYKPLGSLKVDSASESHRSSRWSTHLIFLFLDESTGPGFGHFIRSVPGFRQCFFIPGHFISRTGPFRSQNFQGVTFLWKKNCIYLGKFSTIFRLWFKSMTILIIL